MQTANKSKELPKFLHAFLKDRGFSEGDYSLDGISADGSTRNFWRLSVPMSEVSFIVMANSPDTTFAKRENLAYLKIGRHLFGKGVPLPEIHSFDLTHGWFIIEDFGDVSLQEAGSENPDRTALYEKVVETLFRLQTDGSHGFDTRWCCQTESYDYDVMRRYESNYFRDAFLINYLGLDRKWNHLESPFDYLAEGASGAENHFLLHRDFQSRNIMISTSKIGIIDWQGARLGPLGYDLASLLIDPYSALSSSEKNYLFQCYLQLLRDHQPGLVDPFRRTYPYLAIQRNLQILGAFSYLSKVMEKNFFEIYIPPALESLKALIDGLNDPKLSPLADLLKSLPPVNQ
ncbi:aminoglycoside phosphotransferase family protein [Thermodesulfobacteriota bacterium]